MRHLPLLAVSIAASIVLTTPSLAQQHAHCAPPPAGAPEGPRALSERGLANLVAFTRLLGYVGFFHPSDQAEAADWSQLAIEGVRRMEACEGPEQLAKALEALFRPVAPTVQVFPVGAQRNPPDLPRTAKAGDLRVVYWRHHGAGLAALPLAGIPSIYSSSRVSGPAADMEPGHIFSADLGAGIAAHVPLRLYADAAGTLPHGPLLAPERKGAEPSAKDRATRLAAVAVGWNVLQHFYPYFDVVDTDWPRALTAALSSAATDAGEAEFLRTLERLMAALHDGHGWVGRQPEGKAVQTPAQLPLVWALVEGKLTITHVNAEAAAAGLAAGNVVLEIDGRAVEVALAEERLLLSGATPQFVRHRLARRLLRGEPDSPVRLKVQVAGGTQRTVELRRKPGSVDEPRPAKVAALEPGILYFDINRAEAADFAAALPRLAGAKAVIFDLRGYPRTHEYLSHLSAETLRSAHWQIPVVTKPDRLGSAEYAIGGRWTLPPQSPRLEGRVIFLIDGRAISYAESVMGIVEAYKLADIVGEATAGTNGNVVITPLPGDFTLYWTGMRVLKHDGSRHHGVGIAPTHPVQRTIAGVAAGRDEILEKGLELARQRR
jgi:C-terminal processing protease CtpA/Prc